eukprot:TRINITY_DN31049_c0_g1_i1.p2 TRINITY_DN31049_c0_g1~~TRINITY_DN31049_c0_g1_i1.p2  ORF type:complete len:91 (-),score=9.69 TRINITY_DN31049_c0_g1_i1:2-274(-)
MLKASFAPDSAPRAHSSAGDSGSKSTTVERSLGCIVNSARPASTAECLSAASAGIRWRAERTESRLWTIIVTQCCSTMSTARVQFCASTA